MVSRVEDMKTKVWGYYRQHGRDMPWRRTNKAYNIVLSEIMLQQTQVARVLIKYEEFLKIFPTVQSLAKAPLSKVLKAWQGLGYNRRAVNLQRMAKVILKDYNGIFPKTYHELLELPGIGPGTAGALMNFCFNVPTPFIETNIRTVYLHYFFKGRNNVSDKDILKLIERTIDRDAPREWFYALYDYGAMLKKTVGNPNIRSSHYKKQSAFKDSNREFRSKVLKAILRGEKMSESELMKETSIEKNKLKSILRQYVKESTLRKVGGSYTIAV